MFSFDCKPPPPPTRKKNTAQHTRLIWPRYAVQKVSKTFHHINYINRLKWNANLVVLSCKRMARARYKVKCALKMGKLSWLYGTYFAVRWAKSCRINGSLANISIFYDSWSVAQPSPPSSPRTKLFYLKCNKICDAMAMAMCGPMTFKLIMCFNCLPFFGN